MTADKMLTQEIVESQAIPEEIQKLAALANSDLYHGPLYLDIDGEVVSCFDDGAMQFDFQSACEKISEWCSENIETMYYEVDTGCLLNHEPEEETYYYEVDNREIIKILFGRELANHL